MAYFNEFPYTRNYDADLGWLIRQVKELIRKFDRCPTWYGEWVPEIKYPPLAFVQYGTDGDTYLSLQTVPGNTPITDERYWMKTGSTLEQILQLQRRMNKIEDFDIIYVEDFGAVGDGVTDDSDAFNDALSEAIAKNKILSTQGKKYKITSLTLVQGAMFDGAACTLIVGNVNLTGNAELINSKIDGGNIILSGGLNKISDIEIIDWSGDAIKFETDDYESFIQNVRLDNKTHALDTVGVHFVGGDNVVKNLYGNGAHRGIIFDGSNNMVYDVHLWLRGGDVWSGSRFAEINRTRNVMIGYFCDSYETMLYFGTTGLQISAIGGMWFTNATLFPNVDAYITNIAYNVACFADGDVSIRFTGLSTAGIRIISNNIGYLNIRRIDGDFTKPSVIYHNDLFSALGFTVAGGGGRLEYKAGTLFVNAYGWFPAGASPTEIDLNTIMNVPKGLYSRSIQRARYSDGTTAKDGYVFIDIANSMMNIIVPSDFRTAGTITEIDLNITVMR